jgi:gliding motility-associated-like protein
MKVSIVPVVLFLVRVILTILPFFSLPSLAMENSRERIISRPGSNQTSTLPFLVYPAYSLPDFLLPSDCTSCNLSCAPVARTDFDSVAENSLLKVTVPSIGLNDTYYAPITFTAITKKKTDKGGEVTMETSGTYTYLPPTDFSGTDFFIYEVCNAKGKPGCDTSMIIIKVMPSVAKPPVALTDTFLAVENQIFSGSVTENDLFSGSVTTRIVNGQGSASGKVTLEPTGYFRYDPGLDFTGRDSFYYSLCNSSGSCAIGTVIIKTEHGFIPPDIVIPSGFSPNKDGVNDFLEINNIYAYPGNSVKIFNRWGNVVYEGTGYDNAQVRWDGNATKTALPGETLPEGTYFYVISLGAHHKEYTGYVMLLK